MKFGYENEKIVKLAYENQSEIFDGVVQYDYETGELLGASMSSNTIENPSNPVIEIFRLKAGATFDYGCDDCPYKNNREKHDECCMQVYIDEYFEEDFEDNFEVNVKKQISDVLFDVINDDLQELAEIRLNYYEDFVSETKYQQELSNDTFFTDIFDDIIENALENGFSKDDDFLTSHIDQVKYLFDDILNEPRAGDLEKKFAMEYISKLNDLYH